MLDGQPAARPHLGFIARWQSRAKTAGHEGARTRCKLGPLCGAQVHAGGVGGGVGGQPLVATVGQSGDGNGNDACSPREDGPHDPLDRHSDGNSVGSMSRGEPADPAEQLGPADWCRDQQVGEALEAGFMELLMKSSRVPRVLQVSDRGDHIAEGCAS